MLCNLLGSDSLAATAAGFAARDDVHHRWIFVASAAAFVVGGLSGEHSDTFQNIYLCIRGIIFCCCLQCIDDRLNAVMEDFQLLFV